MNKNEQTTYVAKSARHPLDDDIYSFIRSQRGSGVNAANALLKLWSSLGGVPGQGPLGGLGGSLTGTAVPAAAGGYGGYHAGRLLAGLYNDVYGRNLSPERVGRLTGGVLGAAAAIPGLANIGWNLKRYRSHPEEFDGGNLLQTVWRVLNRAPEHGMLKNNVAREMGKRAALDNAAFMSTGVTGPRPETFVGKPYGIPKHWSMQQIDQDPYMSPAEKARYVTLMANAGHGRTGLVTWGDVARAGVDVGIGYTGASLIGRTVGGLFGMQPSTYKRLQQAGMAAGLLRGVMNIGMRKTAGAGSTVHGANQHMTAPRRRAAAATANLLSDTARGVLSKSKPTADLMWIPHFGRRGAGTEAVRRMVANPNSWYARALRATPGKFRPADVAAYNRATPGVPLRGATLARGLGLASFLAAPLSRGLGAATVGVEHVPGQILKGVDDTFLNIPSSAAEFAGRLSVDPGLAADDIVNVRERMARSATPAGVAGAVSRAAGTIAGSM